MPKQTAKRPALTHTRKEAYGTLMDALDMVKSVQVAGVQHLGEQRITLTAEETQALAETRALLDKLTQLMEREGRWT